ncbi:hypothetical protein [uncultured Nocardioides sp.]|uniref:HD domain-containing protein n=1 Tax=uncultured Nocardioides sp. TaxID=198441 RepID=UPI00261846A5|nr:hypothetical protein [uncultured Nocardioides sp.]
MTDPAPRWPLPGAPALRDELLAAYDEDGRRYHDLRHLGEVLDRLTELSAAGERFDPLTVTLAAWFHDGVHERSDDDEARSAAWAKRALLDLGDGGPGAGVAAEVARLVLLTVDHRADAADGDGAALCDADLAILAAGRERYRAYAADVRAEWSHVPDADFARGRSAVLRDLLDRPVLFATSHARRYWERPARANLAAELSALA